MFIPSAARVHYGCVIFVRILQGLVEVRASFFSPNSLTAIHEWKAAQEDEDGEELQFNWNMNCSQRKCEMRFIDQLHYSLRLWDIPALLFIYLFWFVCFFHLSLHHSRGLLWNHWLVYPVLNCKSRLCSTGNVTSLIINRQIYYFISLMWTLLSSGLFWMVLLRESS